MPVAAGVRLTVGTRGDRVCADHTSSPFPGQRELIVVHGRGKETKLLPLLLPVAGERTPFQITVLTSGGKKRKGAQTKRAEIGEMFLPSASLKNKIRYGKTMQNSETFEFWCPKDMKSNLCECSGTASALSK